MIVCTPFVKVCLLVAVIVGVLSSANALAQTAPNVTTQCIECHTKATPNIVSDWKQSRHSQVEVGCDTCHGSEHMKADDAAKARYRLLRRADNAIRRKWNSSRRENMLRRGSQWRRCQQFTISRWL